MHTTAHCHKAAKRWGKIKFYIYGGPAESCYCIEFQICIQLERGSPSVRLNVTRAQKISRCAVIIHPKWIIEAQNVDGSRNFCSVQLAEVHTQPLLSFPSHCILSELCHIITTHCASVIPDMVGTWFMLQPAPLLQQLPCAKQTKSYLYAFFCVIPWHLNFICRHFGTLCMFHLHRQVGVKNSSHLPAYEDGTVCSEMLAYKIQMPGNYPEESKQHSEHGKSLKSGINLTFSPQ